MKHFLQKIKSAMLALLATVISLPLAPLLTWQNAFADGTTYKLESVGVGGAVPDSEGGSHNAVIMNMSNEATGETVANAYCIELNVDTNIGQGGYELADWATSGIPNLGKVTWILTNSYPQKTVAELNAVLERDDLSENDVASMTQSAIWHFTNGFNPEMSSLSESRKALYSYLINNAEDIPEPTITLPTITVPAVNYLDYLPLGPIVATSVDDSNIKLTVTGSEVTFKYGDDTPVDLSAVKSGQPFFAIPTDTANPGSITFNSSASVTVPAGKVFKHPTEKVQTIIAATAFVKTETVSQVMNWQKVDRTKVKFEKTWVGGPKASEVTVRLLGNNGEEIAHKTISEADDWKGSFNNLPAKDKLGNAIVYTIAEDNIENYTSSIKEQTTNDWLIINTYTSPKIPISATKTWDGGEDFNDGVRPEIYFELWRKNGTAGAGEKVVNATKLVGLTIDFGEQDKTDKNGVEYEYFVKEVNADGTPFTHENYTVIETGLTVTNTYKSSLINIAVKKNWEGGSLVRPLEVIVDLYRNGKLQTGSQISLSDANGWTSGWKNLPKTDSSGKDYIYTVQERSIGSLFTPSYTYSSDLLSLVITNIYKSPNIDIPVQKVWQDKDDNDHIRPDEIIVTLYANGVETDKTLTLKQSSHTDTCKAWCDKFTDIPETDNSGKPITYEVKETETPAGYTSTISGDPTQGFTITNTHTPATVKINVHKR